MTRGHGNSGTLLDESCLATARFAHDNYWDVAFESHPNCKPKMKEESCEFIQQLFFFIVTEILTFSSYYLK